MIPLSRVVALGLTTGALLIGSTVSAAAQDLPACTIAPDSVVVAALGPSAHSLGGFSSPGSDICAVSVDGTKIAIMHLSDFQAGDTGDMPAGAPGASRAAPDQLLGMLTKIDGIGDDAVLATNGSDYMLVVKRGRDVFTFGGHGLADGQTKLVALATAVLANTPQ